MSLNLTNTKHAAIAMAIFEIRIQNSRFIFFDHGVPENLHVCQSLQLKAESNRNLSILILEDWGQAHCPICQVYTHILSC